MSARRWTPRTEAAWQVELHIRLVNVCCGGGEGKMLGTLFLVIGSGGGSICGSETECMYVMRGKKDDGGRGLVYVIVCVYTRKKERQMWWGGGYAS